MHKIAAMVYLFCDSLNLKREAQRGQWRYQSSAPSKFEIPPQSQGVWMKHRGQVQGVPLAGSYHAPQKTSGNQKDAQFTIA